MPIQCHPINFKRWASHFWNKYLRKCNLTQGIYSGDCAFWVLTQQGCLYAINVLKNKDFSYLFTLEKNLK